MNVSTIIGPHLNRISSAKAVKGINRNEFVNSLLEATF